MSQAHELATHVRGQLARVIVGQQEVLDHLLLVLLVGGHALVEGVPGLAKTLAVKTLANIFQLKFQRVQCTPDLMPADVIGANVFNMATSSFALHRGPIFTDLLLVDEINRTPPRTQSALLEAMEERQVTIDGTSYELTPFFTVFSTQNPVEFEGTYPLPEAELDRFMAKVLVGYPEAAVEQSILTKYVQGFEADRPSTYGITSVTDAAGLDALRAAADDVRVEPQITAYITAIVRATREAASLTLGASPRAGVSLLKAARAAALLEGRDYVVPDDVKGLAPAVLRHRVNVAPELELEGVTADVALKAILDKVEVPTA